MLARAISLSRSYEKIVKPWRPRLSLAPNPAITFDGKQEEDIRKRTSAAGINADAASTGLGVSNLGAAGGGDEATQELAAAVESLPKLLEQKKGLEMHTNILKVR